jgi:hypothetical protein
MHNELHVNVKSLKARKELISQAYAVLGYDKNSHHLCDMKTRILIESADTTKLMKLINNDIISL